jgi:5'-3' exonuclease
MLIEIFDSNNWVRRVYEKDTSGLALRNLFTSAYHNPNPVIYVFDGKNGKEARRKIYPGYKSKRLPGSDAFYVTLELFKLLVMCTNKTMICIEGWEADDVIATMIKGGGFQGIPVQIWSNDGDFLALCSDEVKMTDVSQKLAHIPAEHIRLYKALCGDITDSIPGLPTFGPKSFEAVMKKDLLGNWYTVLEKRDLGHFQAADLHVTNSQYLWLEGEGLANILSYWDIINFIHVPKELIDAHTQVGTPNMAAANAILKTVFQ